MVLKRRNLKQGGGQKCPSFNINNFATFKAVMEEQWIKDLREFVCPPPDPNEFWTSAPSPYLGHKWDEERRKYQKEKQAYFFTKDSQSKAGKKGGSITKNNKLGIFADDYNRTPNAKKAGKIGGKRSLELNAGFHSLTSEEKANNSRKGAEAVRSQLWRCKVTGYISNPCGLSNYQKGKGINYRDKSLRERVDRVTLEELAQDPLRSS